MTIFDLLKRVGAGIGMISVPLTFMDTIGHPSIVQGSSMEPTLAGTDGRWWRRDTVWVNKMKREPKVGGIFTFTYPRDRRRTHIKRVTHGSGDMIRLRDGSYHKIESNHCWMTSDNPVNANDSYVYGPVNCGLIKGQATRVIWPLDHWKKL